DAQGPKSKLSAEKFTWPGRKQVYRFSEGGRYIHDTIALENDVVPGGRALLHQVMAGGRRISPPEPLTSIRRRCRETLAALPDELRRLESGGRPYDVQRTPALEAARRAPVSLLHQSFTAIRRGFTGFGRAAQMSKRLTSPSRSVSLTW